MISSIQLTRRQIVLALVSVVVTIASELRAQQASVDSSLSAPDYRHITGHVENANLPLAEPKVLWKYRSEVIPDQFVMHGIGQTAVADGVVYFGDDLGRVAALNSTNGSVIWRKKYQSRIIGTIRITSAPALDESYLYFTSNDGVTAVQRNDGNLVWHFRIHEGCGESMPIPVGERVYVSAYNGFTYALNRADGVVIWKHNFGEDAPPNSPPNGGLSNTVARPRGAACDGKVFVQSVFDQSRVIAVDCETGVRLWAFEAKGWIASEPTLVNGRVYVGSQDDHLYCLKLENGEMLWNFKTPTWLASRPAVHEGKVYLPGHKGRLFQLNAETGEPLHTFEPTDDADRDTMVYSFPIIAGGTVYWALGKGQLYALDIESQTLRWRMRPSDKSELFTDPTTDGERIFVTSRQDGAAGECAVIAIGRKQ